MNTDPEQTKLPIKGKVEFSVKVYDMEGEL